MQTTTQFFNSRTQMEQLSYNRHSNFRITPSQLLLDYTATACCMQWINPSSYSSSFHHLAATRKPTVLKKYLLYLFEKRKLFSRNTTEYTCILIRIKRVTENHAVQQSNFDI
jgi:hypothetical protein